MSNGCGMPYRPGHWRGDPFVDLAWSAILVGAAHLAARWLERIGAAPAFTIYLTAVVLAGAGRGVRSGVAAALSVVALCALRWEAHAEILGLAPSRLSVLLTAFLVLALAAGYATGRARDDARRLAERRRALLTLAKSYAPLIGPADLGETGPKVVRWVHAVMGTEACYLDGPQIQPESEEAVVRWAPAGLPTLAVAAQAQPGRTLRVGRLRARALSDGSEVFGVLAWRSPQIRPEAARHIDLIIADVLELMVTARQWPGSSGAALRAQA